LSPPLADNSWSMVVLCFRNPIASFHIVPRATTTHCDRWCLVPNPSVFCSAKQGTASANSVLAQQGRKWKLTEMKKGNDSNQPFDHLVRAARKGEGNYKGHGARARVSVSGWHRYSSAIGDAGGLGRVAYIRLVLHLACPSLQHSSRPRLRWLRRRCKPDVATSASTTKSGKRAVCEHIGVDPCAGARQATWTIISSHASTRTVGNTSGACLSRSRAQASASWPCIWRATSDFF
jgi:hypothetical protein